MNEYRMTYKVETFNSDINEWVTVHDSSLSFFRKEAGQIAKAYRQFHKGVKIRYTEVGLAEYNN